MVKQDLDVVVAGYIVNEDELLLIHHKKLDKWLPVGGHIKLNETPCEALRREVKEEVGIEIDFLHYPKSRRGNNREYPIPFYVNKHHITESHLHYCLFYLCKPKSLDLQISKSELKDYSWVTQDKLKFLNPKINDGDLITCLEAINLFRKNKKTR